MCLFNIYIHIYIRIWGNNIAQINQRSLFSGMNLKHHDMTGNRIRDRDNSLFRKQGHL